LRAVQVLLHSLRSLAMTGWKTRCIIWTMKTVRMTDEQIRVTGLAALLEKLGPDGMIRFLQQFETGTGDYSTERHRWVDQLDMDLLIKKLREQQSKT